MSEISIGGSNLGTALQELLMSDELQPGDDASYQLCKAIYLYHPLGYKMAESPVRMAQSQQREISIPKSPESRVKEAFLAEWAALNADEVIERAMVMSRVYGVASVVLVAEGVPAKKHIKPQDLSGLKISFNVLDPLNTSGSIILNQNPNSVDFQKPQAISVQGVAYHQSRACVVMNEQPVYIAYTTSAFGFVGRSVYQRALFPLKSFVQTMITDDMVTKKAGLLVAKMKQAGSIVDGFMARIANIKRNVVKWAITGNVISVDVDESIETLNMQNADKAMSTPRTNILENVAVSADMPAKLLNSETFAEGFGEGTEDAKNVARYIETIRKKMNPLYSFFDGIVMYRAWTPEFFETIKAEFPDEYGNKGYAQAFFEWKNSFVATWPSLLIEPESERVKVEDVKLKGIVSLIEALVPQLDPENKAKLIMWAASNFNEQKLLFPNTLDLDYDDLANYVPPMPMTQSEPEPKEKLAA